MKILIAPDKFKGSIGSVALCNVVGEEIHAIMPDAILTKMPLADGGDGFSGIIRHYFRTESIAVETTDPLGRPLSALYQFDADTRTAYIEMSAASGLALLQPEERDPLKTSTRGTGLMIADAIAHGAARIVLGIGGSATNDAGTGMAHALGYRFLHKQGKELEPAGGNLCDIDTIIPPHHDIMQGVECLVACDVKNPLYGHDGAAYVYAPQKGATTDMVELLDSGLRHMDELFRSHFGRSMALAEGAGAAGGMGAGAEIFLGARMISGMAFLAAALGLEDHIRRADIIITGEGRFDDQSFSGKVVGEVAAQARKHGKPVWVICGSSSVTLQDCLASGITRITDIASIAPDTVTSIRDPEPYIRIAVRKWWPQG